MRRFDGHSDGIDGVTKVKSAMPKRWDAAHSSSS
jgi:hypothetical protein